MERTLVVECSYSAKLGHINQITKKKTLNSIFYI
jgi:hypothetical protein